jgi:hypothetical protein
VLECSAELRTLGGQVPVRECHSRLGTPTGSVPKTPTASGASPAIPLHRPRGIRHRRHERRADELPDAGSLTDSWRPISPQANSVDRGSGNPPQGLPGCIRAAVTPPSERARTSQILEIPDMGGFRALPRSDEGQRAVREDGLKVDTLRMLVQITRQPGLAWRLPRKR